MALVLLGRHVTWSPSLLSTREIPFGKFVTLLLVLRVQWPLSLPPLLDGGSPWCQPIIERLLCEYIGELLGQASPNHTTAAMPNKHSVMFEVLPFWFID